MIFIYQKVTIFKIQMQTSLKNDASDVGQKHRYPCCNAYKCTITICTPYDQENGHVLDGTGHTLSRLASSLACKMFASFDWPYALMLLYPFASSDCRFAPLLLLLYLFASFDCPLAPLLLFLHNTSLNK
jgi:hypothetical protein